MREGAGADGAVFGGGIGEASLESWFTEPKLPLGRFVKMGITWLQDNAAGFFDAVTATIDFLVDGSTAILLHVPFLIVVLAVAALAYWLHRSWRLAAFVVVAFIFIANLGYWQATVETISLVGFSTLASVIIGVPLGVAAAHRPWLYAFMRPLLDLMQTLPTFVYLIPTLVLFHLGRRPDSSPLSFSRSPRRSASPSSASRRCPCR